MMGKALNSLMLRGAFLGRAEERDGFVEVYDGNWNLLGRLLDGNGQTVSEIEALFPGFQAAWDAVSLYLPLGLSTGRRCATFVFCR